MKKYLLSLVVLVAVSIGFSSQASAQRFYVNIRPTAPVIVHRPPPPSRAHVWIGEDWEYRNGAYVHVGGHWTLPPAHHRYWVAGHWAQERGHGHYWVAGHWN